MPSHAATYRFIELALADREQSFASLDQEMSTFQPLPLTSFESERREMLGRLRALNPDKPVEQLERYVDSQFAEGHSEFWQLADRFLNRFAAEQVAITMISYSLCEAVINAILALGLSVCGRVDYFRQIDRRALVWIWTIGPQAFLPKYLLPITDARHVVLDALVEKRHSFVHSEITIRDDDNAIVLEGSAPLAMSLDEAARDQIKQYLRLPYELHKYACEQTTDRFLFRQIEHLLSAKQPMPSQMA